MSTFTYIFHLQPNRQIPLFLFLFFVLSGGIINDLYGQPPMKFITPFETTENYSATFNEAVSYYQLLDNQFEELSFSPFGTTDSGEPLYLGALTNGLSFDEEGRAEADDKIVLLINNAIHPGEPCGVDATMMLVRDLLIDSKKKELLDHVLVLFIPMYNVGGALNRTSTSRANQNGPAAYGFRGNSKNLDLNRDFIKCDSKNAQSFNRLFGLYKPHVLIDNHTSNGADYQYTMTVVPPQKDKLGGPLSDYLTSALLPDLFQQMEAGGWEMTPYVYARNTPDEGIYGFLDFPRYSSGYAALHHCIGIMPETHMLKPFKDRVVSTYHFMDVMLQLIRRDKEKLQQARTASIDWYQNGEEYPINWNLDPSQSTPILFKGYKAKYKPSSVSGLDRLYYDRSEPFEKEIPYFNTYQASQTRALPKAYVIPEAYERIIERLAANQVQMQRLQQDTVIQVEQYYIEDYSTRERPYEGHYLHSNVKLRTVSREWAFQKGDVLIACDQAANRLLLETLEPDAPDSYFCWNFFDGILMQKEYFSPYVFEDLAAELLEQQPALREELEKKKQEDPEFAESAYAQLDFIYKRSPYYEPTYQLYPVARIVTD
jgi:hypothetical protein